jgi:hypothetical protein
VFATPQTDANGNNYPIPRIRNITTTSFELSVCVDRGQPTCDTTALGENIGIVVVDTDLAPLVPGIDIGTRVTASNGSNTPITFNKTFGAIPSIFTTAQTSSQ